MKAINWKEKKFEANGRTYYISGQMSIGRSVYAEEAKIEMESGVRVGKTTESFSKIYELLNKGKQADAAVECYNHIKAIDGFFERPAPVLRLCACFINHEGEDTKYINDSLVAEKVKDWSEEGLAMDSFFQLALIFIYDETADLKKFTGLISEVIKKQEGKPPKAVTHI